MNIGDVPGRDRTTFTYRELYLKFRDSLSIDGSDLKDRISDSSGRWFPSVCARCCSAAEACLAEKSKSGAANIHTAFWDSEGNWGNGCGSVLEAFLGQLRIEDDETLRTLLRFNTGGDKSFSLMAGFFAHQARSMFEYGAPRNCITVLKALLSEWWRSFSESFTASDKAGCMNWFDDNIGKIRLTAKLSEKAKEDKFMPEERKLAPPAVGKGVIDNCILRIRDDLNQKNDDFWGSIKNKEGIKSTIQGYCGPSAEFLAPERATEILMLGAPSSHWEVACAAAGLVEFEWKEKESDDA